MSILSTPPVQLTAAQGAALGVRELNTATLTGFVSNFKELFNRIWNRSDGVKPQQVFDEFGTDAAKLFASASATVTFIETVAAANGQSLADYLAPADYTPPLPYTINADGSVTVQEAAST